MFLIYSSIAFYLIFNVAIWLSLGKGGLIAMAAANAIGALTTGAYYRKQLSGKPQWSIALLGSFGILAIVMGLRGSHAHLPISLSIEAVYNGFACLSWPLFVGLNRFWPSSFVERPNRFDLVCHALMGIMVTLRFCTYGNYSFELIGLMWIGLAIAGYMIFNISIKLGKGHRPTNITMNLGGAGLLILMTFGKESLPTTSWSTMLPTGMLLGGLAIFGIVKSLGDSYAYFGKLGRGSLVAPLVYDGILVASPSLMILTGEHVSGWTFAVAAGMFVITIARYRHHSKKS